MAMLIWGRLEVMREIGITIIALLQTESATAWPTLLQSSSLLLLDSLLLQPVCIIILSLSIAADITQHNVLYITQPLLVLSLWHRQDLVALPSSTSAALQWSLPGSHSARPLEVEEVAAVKEQSQCQLVWPTQQSESRILQQCKILGWLTIPLAPCLQVIR